jgi:Transposase and inactivated derivatives
MSYLGLTPSEYSSGERRRLGAITQAGNTHARRVLIERPWAYRYPAKVQGEGYLKRCFSARPFLRLL